MSSATGPKQCRGLPDQAPSRFFFLLLCLMLPSLLIRLLRPLSHHELLVSDGCSGGGGSCKVAVNSCVRREKMNERKND